MKRKNVFLIGLLTIILSSCDDAKYPPPKGETCTLFTREDSPGEFEECYCVDTRIKEEDNQSYSKDPIYCAGRTSVTLDYQDELVKYANENRLKRIKAENELELIRKK